MTESRKVPLGHGEYDLQLLGLETSSHGHSARGNARWPWPSLTAPVPAVGRIQDLSDSLWATGTSVSTSYQAYWPVAEKWQGNNAFVSLELKHSILFQR